MKIKHSATVVIGLCFVLTVGWALAPSNAGDDGQPTPFVMPASTTVHADSQIDEAVDHTSCVRGQGAKATVVYAWDVGCERQPPEVNTCEQNGETDVETGSVLAAVKPAPLPDIEDCDRLAMMGDCLGACDCRYQICGDSWIVCFLRYYGCSASCAAGAHT